VRSLDARLRYGLSGGEVPLGAQVDRLAGRAVGGNLEKCLSAIGGRASLRRRNRRSFERG
jgi:hypothetical protein